MNCYCGSGKSFQDCCEPLIRGERLPYSPEELMRSRYTAYATRQMQYLVDTTDPQALGEIDHRANQEWAEKTEFIGLEIVKSSEEGNKGTVEFKAQFKVVGSDEVQTHHEVSTFRKQSGRWYFRKGRGVK